MRSSPSLLHRQILSPWFVLYLSGLYLLCLLPFRPEIATAPNLVNVAVAAAPLIVLAVGQTFVVVTGGIDLSVTAIVSCASVAAATAMRDNQIVASLGLSLAAGVAGAGAVGVTAGLLHGLSVAKLAMPPLLVTLVSLMFFEGLAEFLTQSQPIGNLPESFIELNYANLLKAPVPVLVAVAVAGAAHVLLFHTVFGRRLFAVGQNSATARVSGLPISATLVSAYLISGCMAAIATLLYMMRLETGKPDLVSESVLLDCVAAVVIGGASLAGGRGTIVGAVLGAIFLTLVSNGMQLLGTLQIWHILLVKGGIILLAAGLQSWRTSLGRRVGVTV